MQDSRFEIQEKGRTHSQVTSDEWKDNAPFSSLRDSLGFSLLEMMTVITLILILATFSMPIYHSIKDKEKARMKFEG